MERKYKIGDRVKVKSLDWFNANKDIYDNVTLGGNRPSFTRIMSRYCGQVMTIVDIDSEYGDYNMKEDDGCFSWDADMFEGVVDADKLNVYGVLDNPMVDDCGVDDYIQRFGGNECKIALPEGYQFIDRQGNIIDTSIIMVTKKVVEYPKNYSECCNVLDDDDKMSLEVMNELRKLINARNAYWKIYGEANGLGRSWEPDYKNPDIDLYVIINIYNQVEKAKYGYGFQQCILAFPTEELRDMFYERFKTEIEFCKKFI